MGNIKEIMDKEWLTIDKARVMVGRDTPEDYWEQGYETKEEQANEREAIEHCEEI